VNIVNEVIAVIQEVFGKQTAPGAVLACVLCWAPVAQGAITLRPGVPVVLPGNAPAPVRRAAQDLRRDLATVLGAQSPLLSDVAELGGQPGIVIAAPGLGPERLLDGAVQGREAHAVFVRAPLVVLQGADVRGAIYAIYSFSDRYLDVPPLWYWASWTPPRKDEVRLADDTRIVFGSPHVRWRAWFPNDQDLLTQWRSRSQENLEAQFETMLRLKLNTYQCGLLDGGALATPYRAGRDARLARDRGLALTDSHISVFGASYREWEPYWTRIRKQQAPALLIANGKALEEFWLYHAQTAMREGMEMVWPIGFRGVRDEPFWQAFPDAPKTDAERARVIQQMMQRQVDLLKQETGNPAPPMLTTLYNENSDFFAQGLLRPPAEPSLIWNFVAARRDHFPAADVRNVKLPKGQPFGYYMNFQFTSSGSHLAQGEGPWKMERNFRTVGAIGPRPLEFSVVNAGNIREFVLELSANAEMMWEWDKFDADRFLRAFCRRYFGEKQAGRAAALYRDFYNSYWTQKKADVPGFERQYIFQDQRYARAIELILAQIPKGRSLDPLTDRAMDTGGRYFRIVPADNGADNQVEAILRGTDASMAKLRRVVAGCDALGEEIPPPGRAFFNDNLRMQAAFMHELNGVLQSLARALAELPDRAAAARHVAAAGDRADAMARVLKDAEHGRFQGWYDGERLFGVRRIKERIQAVLDPLRTP